MTDVFLAPLIMISNVNAQMYPSFLYIFSLLVFMVKIVILEYLEQSRAIYMFSFASKVILYLLFCIYLELLLGTVRVTGYLVSLADLSLLPIKVS